MLMKVFSLIIEFHFSENSNFREIRVFFRPFVVLLVTYYKQSNSVGLSSSSFEDILVFYSRKWKQVRKGVQWNMEEYPMEKFQYRIINPNGLKMKQK